jgi:RNA polymerase sigma-70 factor (ECF subfamily)
MSLAAIRPHLPPFPGTSNPSSTDGQLLQRYVASRDEDAFAGLVRRYGSLVLGVCESVLENSQDSEDAFQATFLVLSRRASNLDGQRPLGNWLHAVAFRTALKARQTIVQRRRRELQMLDVSTIVGRNAQGREESEWSDLRPLLDEELNQLPEKYRAPLVLCFLEGKSHLQAARELGWPSGSMSRRMNRARKLLQKRLARRGVTLSAGALFLLIAKNAGAVTVTPTLIAATAKAALAFSIGQVGLQETISSHVASLTEQVLRTMTVATSAKAGSALTTLLLLILIVASGGILAYEIKDLLQLETLWGCGTPSQVDHPK